MKPKVSIIVPVYNAENYLDVCIQSILAQELTDWELILVNDGSRDQSLEICRRYETQDERICVLDGPNGGVSAARNRGLDAARGEYIGFVDADDFIAPQMYRKMIETAEQKQAELVFCDHVEWQNGKERLPREFHFSKPLPSGTEVLKILYTQNGYCMCLLYQKKLLDEHEIRFLDGMTFAEDRLFVSSCLLYALRVGKCEETLYYYRINEKSTTGRYMPMLERDIKRYQTRMQKLLLSCGLQEELSYESAYRTAICGLYAVFNVCKPGSPFSMGKRMRYARKIVQDSYYQNAAKLALQNKTLTRGITRLMFLTIRFRMGWLDVLYYSWCKPLMTYIWGINGRIQK